MSKNGVFSIAPDLFAIMGVESIAYRAYIARVTALFCPSNSGLVGTLSNVVTV